MNITSIETGPLAVNTFFIPTPDNRIVLVDPGGDIKKITEHLKTMGDALALILLTHSHFDHLGALAQLHSLFPEIEIAIHTSEASWLGEGAIEKHAAFFKHLGAEFLVRSHTGELPFATQLLEEGKPIRLTGGKDWEGWVVLSTPGHSPGSICLYNEQEALLISGDTLFNAGVGRTDGPGGSAQELRASLKRLASLPKTVRVFPGHGPETTIEREW